MKKSIILSISIFLFYCGCEKNNMGYIYSPTKSDIENLHNFQVIQIDYDSLLINSKSNLIVNSQFIDKIIIGELIDRELHNSDTLFPHYLPYNRNYLVSFTLSKKIEIEKYDYLLAIKYLFNNGSCILIDSLIHLYKFPYTSTEIFLPLHILSPDSYVTIVQDFDINKNGLVFHPFGPLGLFFYDFDNLTTKEFRVIGYVGGDMITADTLYAFVDVNGYGIVRYNFKTDTADIIFDLSELPFNTGLIHCIYGMDIYRDSLYVLIEDTDMGQLHLVKFDFEGNYHSDFLFPTYLDYICLDNDIVYGYQRLNGGRFQIIRFDLIEKRLLESWPSAAPQPLGLRIIDNKLYYIDHFRRILNYFTINL